jgi:1-acyl-sn-glycerol-3-phosphate acyltransferase
MVKSTWLFYFARSLFRLLFGTLWRWEIVGKENIPKDGKLIIAPNHASVADPPLTGSAMDRPLYFMAKKELFEIPVLGFLIHRTHAFPIERGKGDIGALRTAKRLIDSEKAVLLFPEGTRSRDGNFGKARPGVGMLSCLCQAPVVPVRIINSNFLSKFKKLKVIFGKPVYPPKEYTKESYQKISEVVLEEIKKLS